MSKSPFNNKSGAHALRKAGFIAGKIMGRAVTDPAGAIAAFTKLAVDAPGAFMTLAAQAIKVKMTVGARMTTQPRQLDGHEFVEAAQHHKGSAVSAFAAGMKRGTQIAAREKLARQKKKTKTFDVLAPQ